MSTPGTSRFSTDADVHSCCWSGEAKAKMGVAQPRVPCLRGCGLILLRTEMQVGLGGPDKLLMLPRQWA